ncbi:FAD-dependent oxidoreductase [Luteimicrobium xylanilyticum]|uniref:Coenzyme A disulfide reductase n=1 Tax=Luteimicrobium xylanilyticum TaxID=1133546 RepID=A0A5P9Q8G4_9MICO|nr:FAD-dependent oxidoreductase [Luteimicrobium xylanilyticum]QFU97704.1 Coenzyme A disulfide reductase [Luteimicrobium xylanilyticum]
MLETRTNPVAHPDAPTRRYVVVGGVAAGASAAARLRRLDETAEIVVLERGPHVSFAGCGLPYLVGGEIADADDLLVQTPESLRAALNLDVRTAHDVVGLDADARTVRVRTADGETDLGYDALVLAPGAVAAHPALPGLGSPRVHTLRTVADGAALRALVGTAHRAVVLGGGYVGLEAAEALTLQGLDVALAQRSEHVLATFEPELAQLVTDELVRLGVDVYAGSGATAVEHLPDHDVVVLADGTRLEADVVLVATGVRPDTHVFEEAGVRCEDGAIVVDDRGRTSLPGVWAAGDATTSTDAVTGARRPVTLAGPANRAGRLVADDIVGHPTARPVPRPLGTAIVRVGTLTAATTGANRADLDALGVPYRTLHLHPTQHAGWFPGAAQLHLVVHAGADDGRVLGAQAVGPDGVDKRIDVLATALRAHLTVHDLVDLDLAYAPPYGAAKDPVTMVGLLGSNVVDGTLRLWYADQVDEVSAQALVLDVRSRDEFATGHLPGALNVPHTELRDRLDEVRTATAGRAVRVLCASGVRSYLAHRILAQHGFDSASLSGGMLTLRAALGPRAAVVLARPDDAATGTAPRVGAPAEAEPGDGADAEPTGADDRAA